MTNKVKIGVDVTKQNFLQFQVEDGLVAINTVLTPALNLIGFELTSETLKDCLSGCESIHSEYLTRLAKDLTAISIPSTRSLLDKTAGEAWYDFKATLEKALSKITLSARVYISVENEIAILSNEAKEQLLEDCSIYLTDPEEIDLYNRHCAATEALNSFFQGRKVANWQMLFEWVEGKFIPAQGNYEYMKKQIAQLKAN